MKVYFKDQRSRLDLFMDEFKRIPVMTYDKARLKEGTSTIEVVSPVPFNQLNLTAFFDYRIFPANIMAALGQWELESRPMRSGDTIVQQAYLPPWPACSQKIVFAVRVNAIIDTAERKGFSYETLEGHVERGISTFTMERQGDGMVFKVHTFSSPGTVLTKLLGPIFSRPYQTHCTRAALRNVKEMLEQG